MQMAIADDTGQGAHNVRLVLEVHGQVGVGPVSQHAHTDKILALAINLARGIVATLLAELGRGDLHTGLTHLFLNI